MLVRLALSIEPGQYNVFVVLLPHDAEPEAREHYVQVHASDLAPDSLAVLIEPDKATRQVDVFVRPVSSTSRFQFESCHLTRVA
jgi:hypothetical protein